MTLNREAVEKLRALAKAGVGATNETKAFGVLGADLVAELCDGWLEADALDPYAQCCCGECV